MAEMTELTRLAIDLIDVRKSYPGGIEALRGVSVQVGRSEIFGLLGPNGAGKSTLVKIMMTNVRPTRALGTLLGRPLGHRGKLARVGYLPEGQRFPGYQTAAQYLDFCGAMTGLTRKERRSRAPRVIERVGLTDVAQRKIRTFSKGMRQRLGLSQALLNEPELLILDEPTDGLDPIARRQMREIFFEERARGCTIFLNSHLLSEIELVCDRVAILMGGMVARQGRLADLTDQVQGTRIRLEGESFKNHGAVALPQGAAWTDATTVFLESANPDRVNGALDQLRARGALIQTVETVRPTLEDILMEVLQSQSSAAGRAPKQAVGVARPAPGGIDGGRESDV